MSREVYQLFQTVSRIECLGTGAELFNTEYLQWEERRQEAICEAVSYAQENRLLDDPSRFGIALSEERYEDAYATLIQ